MDAPASRDAGISASLSRAWDYLSPAVARLAGEGYGTLAPVTGWSPRPLEQFDPQLLGRTEAATWAAYYRREWSKVLPLSVRLTREAFGLPWLVAPYAAMLTAQATRAWAPYPDNDPQKATRCLEQLYGMVFRIHRLPLDAPAAARLEVEWWRVHRGADPASPGYHDPIAAAVAAAYGYLYQRPAGELTEAGWWRAEAMRLSDRARRAGGAGEAAEAEITAALVRCYTIVRAAVSR